MSRVWLSVCHVFISVLLLVLVASGQDFPKAEVFGGFSYLRVDTQGATGTSLTNECNILSGGACPLTFQIRPGFKGWDAGAQFNVSRWLGIKTQLAGQYGNILGVKFVTAPPITPFQLNIPDQHIYDFLFGPVISRRTEKYTAFVHGLLGAERVGFSSFQTVAGAFGTLVPPNSKTDFAFALGGGLDLNLSKHFAIRAGQFDYQLVKTSGGHENDFRYAAGVVFRMGGQK